MPVLPRRRDEIGEPVEELKRREVDDTARTRPRGLSRAARADPVGRCVSGEQVADFGDAAVCTTPYGESLEGKGWPGAGSRQVFQTLKTARPVAIDEYDPDTGSAWTQRSSLSKKSFRVQQQKHPRIICRLSIRTGERADDSRLISSQLQSPCTAGS
jgi:hypothetical protein